MAGMNRYTLLSSVSANTDGTAIDAAQFKNFTCYFEHSGVATGADLKLQAQSPSGQWHDVSEATISGAAGNEIKQGFGPFVSMRGQVSNYTDGTFSVYLDAMDW